MSRPSVVTGYPIRRSPDQRLLATSPELIAGCDVLHQRFLPRHPPCALMCTCITFTETRKRSPCLRVSTRCSTLFHSIVNDQAADSPVCFRTGSWDPRLKGGGKQNRPGSSGRRRRTRHQALRGRSVCVRRVISGGRRMRDRGRRLSTNAGKEYRSPKRVSRGTNPADLS